MYGRMQFRTIVQIEPPTFTIAPFEHIFLVGSCFADNIGKRFIEEKFNAIVNPAYGRACQGQPSGGGVYFGY